MKKIILILLSGLFLGACAQKTCPTYASADLDQIDDIEVTV